MRRTVKAAIAMLLIGGAIFLGYWAAGSLLTPSQVKLAYYAESADQLIEVAPSIIRGEAMGKRSTFAHGGVSFVRSKISVHEVLQGDIQANEEIWLLQTELKQDPIVRKGEQLLLFLEKYDGPVVHEDAYVSVGLYQGHYIITADSELLPSLPDSNKAIFAELKELGLAGLKERIKLRHITAEPSPAQSYGQ